MTDEWAEMHGYVNRCAGCGQLTDSAYCSIRCEILDSRDEPCPNCSGNGVVKMGQTLGGYDINVPCGVCGAKP